MNQQPCGVVRDINNVQHLWRSVRTSLDSLAWHADEQRWLPAGNALQFDDDWSSSWREHLTEVHELAAADAVGTARPLMFEVAVREVRALGMAVEHTPEGDRPIECAHTSTWYQEDHQRPIKPERARLRNALGSLLTLVHGTITLAPPPGA